MGHPQTRSLLALLLLVLTLAAPSGAAEPGAETPEALVARMEAAAARGDFVDLLACVAPDERREMALVMVAGAGMMVAFMGMGIEMAGGMAEALMEELVGEEPAPQEGARRAEESAAAVAEAAAAQSRFEGILEKHGFSGMMDDDEPLPEDSQARSAALAALFGDTDEIALLEDLFALMGELGAAPGEETGAPQPVTVPAALGEFVIEGDHATARAGDETVEMVRVDGRWYFKAAR
jgi:hypothetical protein